MNDVAAMLDRCRDSIARWGLWAERHFTEIPGRPGEGCFGTGYNSWGVQTQQKYLAAMAVLATERRESEAGLSREQAGARALAALRFSLASHHTGDGACTDGTKWGRTWISVLGVERMMHGVDRLWPLLEEADRRAVRELLCDEADFQLTREIVADPWARTGRNKPESNLWNGAICARAAARYPEDPRAGAWLEQAHRYFINGISIAADAEDQRVLGGREIRERHIGANFFENYALDHHSYLNVGYMVICLSNIALLHYGLKAAGHEPPETLYHHAEDLWGVLRRMIFSDGRLARIGGDTRVRYCYCQDYLIPALLLAGDLWDDPWARGLLAGAVEIPLREQAAAGDGRYLVPRLSGMEQENPYYHTRLESDRAAVLSMLLAWADALPAPREETADPKRFEPALAGTWCESEHGDVMHRCPTRIVSFSWRAAEPPQGLCLPPDEGDLAEWEQNLGGCVEPIGIGQGYPGRRVDRYAIHTFEGGFVTSGLMIDGEEYALSEGWIGKDLLRRAIAFAALPDGRSALRLEMTFVPAGGRVYVRRWWGVGLNVLNETFLPAGRRRFTTCSGELELPPHLGDEQLRELEGTWVNVEDRIGLLAPDGGPAWTLYRPGRRRGGKTFGNALSDVLCLGGEFETRAHFGPAVLADNACGILSGVTAGQTARKADEAPPRRATLAGPDAALCRAIALCGAEGRRYVLAANFSNEAAEVRLDDSAPALVQAAPQAAHWRAETRTLTLPAWGATLLAEG